ncbi:MAG: hypothetical protein DBX47_07210 [Clostridiales bacterium]|nr:MAG: hypothetical protein DBX47_07210 [Clostridiales bacterium]
MSIQQLADLNFLNTGEIAFEKESGGYLKMTYGDNEYSKIKFSRVLPYKMPESYICILDKDGKEIGIIKELNELDKTNEILVREQINRLYYCPTVLKIISVKEKMGYMYFEVITAAGKRNFAIKDPSRNIRFIDPDVKKEVQISDVDGNRYKIEDFCTFHKAGRKKIEAYLI